MGNAEFVDEIKKKGFIWHAKEWKHEQAFHKHKKAQLVFIEKGYQYLHTKTGRFLLPSNHAAWIPSNMWHKTTATSEFVSLWTLYYDVSNMSDFYNELHFFAVPPVLREMVRYTVKWSLNMEHTPNEQVFLNAILQELPSFVQANIPLRIPVPESEALLSLTDYIHQNLAGNLYIPDLAAQYPFSIRTLERQFKKETGISVAKYIQLVRMIKSIELLHKSELSIKQIATRVGYGSAESYSNLFEKLIGKRPSTFIE